MPAFKPAYLIHGDDHGRLGERRARLRALAEAEAGPHGVELLEGEAATPARAAEALCALTFATGRRFIVVDGAERWKEGELGELVSALVPPPPDTTIAFFAREDGRVKAPTKLHDAVVEAGGDVSAEETVKPWELPRWAGARARELGLELEPGAAKALVAHVGERQQRLQRELEKLALMLGPGTRVGLTEVEEVTASSAERKVWTLADALVARDAPGAVRCLLELREQGERLPGLIYAMVSRLRIALGAAEAMAGGQSSAQVKKTLRIPPKAADALLADVRRSSVEALRAALAAVADLELASRGGGPMLTEDTLALRAVEEISAA